MARPLAGLRRRTSFCEEDGREQKIAVFDKESALSAVDRARDRYQPEHAPRFAAGAGCGEALRALRFCARWTRFRSTRSAKWCSESTPGFTPDLKRIDEAIDHIRVGAATALYDAIYLVSRSLDKRKGRKVIVLITDGGDTISKVDYKQAVRAAEEAEALVYSIIIVPIENSAGRETGGEHALIQLSEDTGGKYYYATSTAQLDDAFRKISDELRTQYLLAYYPTQRSSFSEFRRIQVKVAGVPEAADYHVRHRAGYYTVKSDF